MNEVEYFSYLLRLRRYGENEMLNNVLLLNQNTFLLDDYNFDIWIRKAYNTLLKMKIDPTYINKDPIRQNRKNYKAHFNNTSASCEMDEKTSNSTKKDFSTSLQNYFRKNNQIPLIIPLQTLLGTDDLSFLLPQFLDLCKSRFHFLPPKQSTI